MLLPTRSSLFHEQYPSITLSSSFITVGSKRRIFTAERAHYYKFYRFQSYQYLSPIFSKRLEAIRKMHVSNVRNTNSGISRSSRLTIVASSQR